MYSWTRVAVLKFFLLRRSSVNLLWPYSPQLSKTFVFRKKRPWLVKLVTPTLREALHASLVGSVHNVPIPILVRDDFLRVFLNVLQNVFLFGRKLFRVFLEVRGQVLRGKPFWSVYPRLQGCSKVSAAEKGSAARRAPPRTLPPPLRRFFAANWRILIPRAFYSVNLLCRH